MSSQPGPQAARPLQGDPWAELGARLARREGPLQVGGLRGSARAIAVARLAAARPRAPLLVLVPGAKAADRFAREVRTALGETEEREGGRVLVFPRHDVLPYERFSPQPFLVAQRMEVLYRWLASPAPGAGRAREEEPPLVVASWTALALRVPSRDALRSRTVHFEVGQRMDRDALVEVLLAAGYQRMPIVEERGEVAVRGHLVDLYPPQRELPLRIEWIGDEIEAIRAFDPASQRSQGTLAAAVAPPPRELLFDRALVVQRGEAIREFARAQGVAEARIDEWIGSLLRGHLPPGAEAMAPLLQPAQERVFDYLPEDLRVVIDDPAAGRERLARFEIECREHFEIAQASGRLAAPPPELLLTAQQIEAELQQRAPLALEGVVAEAGGARLTLATSGHEALRTELARERHSERPLAPLVKRLAQWQAAERRIVLACSSLSHAERLRRMLDEHGFRVRSASDAKPEPQWSAPGAVEVRIAPLEAGFDCPAAGLTLLTEEEIFGPRERRRVRSNWPESASIESLAHLRTGDPLVHRDHGIGLYRGLFELDLRGTPSEFLRIDYAEDARLFVPVHRLNLVQRYAGSDGQTPRIDKLGGQTWERAKSGIRKSMRNMARELLAVHAARELTPGYAFSPRDTLLEEFEATFPFEETPDQLAAIEDTLADMQRPKAMDRLVCGDVGYGKTEVAVRAAFRAVMDGKQVAVLVPTTILCQQHENTFRQRFEGHPVRIESLSRFQSAKESREVREGLASGQVDVVIATHRLLQKQLVFRNLGLLVVDEEHRFGVAHKERIKQLAKTVDVLTLTATPIPRTLQLAFAGVRDLSVIDTPPADRLAIRSQVCRFSEDLVREAIRRELRRGGQCFYVHNRVHDIGALQQMLARVVPEARVIVAHGQLPEQELEKRMLAFLRGEGDVLLCTTIIESGLDIPRANTILIDAAHQLGLAQLHQLRGRVGRGRRRAYAYFLVPPGSAPAGDAARRLEAIQDHSALGSGFRLANLDLEIRGAGNLLGAEQSGNLAEVGYETYMEMLQETIHELRGEPTQREVDPEIRLPIEARLPDDYVADVSQRLVLYKRLASCTDDLEVDRIRDELLDRFGALPPAVANLVGVIRLKLRARRLGIAAIDLQKGDLVFSAAETSRIDPHRLLELLKHERSGMRLAPGQRIHASAPDSAPEPLLERARAVLDRLASAAL